MKNIDVRKYIINNFKDDDISEIRKSIQVSVDGNDEDPLIGLGVFLELAWTNGDEEFKDNLINNIKKGMQ